MRLPEFDPIQADANRIRTAASIESTAVVPDILAVLRAVDVAVAVRVLGPDGPDGIYVRRGVVVLNASRFQPRLRFVAAHELAHDVYGDPPHVDRDVEACEDDAREVRASAFAARFLVTREAIWSRRRQFGQLEIRDILALAREFSVSYRLMVERLEDAGVIDTLAQARLLAEVRGEYHLGGAEDVPFHEVGDPAQSALPDEP